MKKSPLNKSSGFTLIELISVIVILGVLATAISSFIKFASQIYSETTTRDQLVSSARFAIERLNRDIREALPNSLRLTGSNQCLEFTPIIESTTYLDIPVAPEISTNYITVIPFNEAITTGWSAIIYPLNPSDVYDATNGKVLSVNSIVDDSKEKWVIIINDGNSAYFKEDSPTQRVYFINTNSSIKYCIDGDTLTRNGILMAQDISEGNSSFKIQEATLRRNAMVQVHFQFEKNNEIVTFNNEIQVLNVP
jgi:MSHA biogenesis protein MshO